MHTVKLLTSLVEHHQILAYCLIFVGLIFEGEFILISAGILAHLGALNFWFALGFIYLGGACKTMLGYYIGRAVYRKWRHLKVFQYLEKRVSNILPSFSEKPFWSIFASKFIMGINHIVILFSGYKKVPLKKYLKAEGLSTLIWAPLLLTLGYFFSYTALNVSREIWRFSLIVAGLFVAFIIIDKFIGWLYLIFQQFYEEKHEEKRHERDEFNKNKNENN
jgi:membrane-associated protein